MTVTTPSCWNGAFQIDRGALGNANQIGQARFNILDDSRCGSCVWIDDPHGVREPRWRNANSRNPDAFCLADRDTFRNRSAHAPRRTVTWVFILTRCARWAGADGRESCVAAVGEEVTYHYIVEPHGGYALVEVDDDKLGVIGHPVVVREITERTGPEPADRFRRCSDQARMLDTYARRFRVDVAVIVDRRYAVSHEWRRATVTPDAGPSTITDATAARSGGAGFRRTLSSRDKDSITIPKIGSAARKLKGCSLARSRGSPRADAYGLRTCRAPGGRVRVEPSRCDAERWRVLPELDGHLAARGGQDALTLPGFPKRGSPTKMARPPVRLSGAASGRVVFVLPGSRGASNSRSRCPSSGTSPEAVKTR